MPQTLRVLFLMEDLCFGGTQRQMLELARRLDRGRFTPVMLTLTGPTDLDALARQEPDLVAVPFSEPIYFDTVLLWKRDQYLYNDVEHFLRFAKTFKFQGIIEKT